MALEVTFRLLPFSRAIVNKAVAPNAAHSDEHAVASVVVAKAIARLRSFRVAKVIFAS